MLSAQRTSIKISDYLYSSTFNNGKCTEYLRVTAHFSTGEAPNTFINYTRGNTNAEDQEYTLQGVVSKLVVSVYAKDRIPGGRFTRCRNSTEIIEETYDIPVDVNSCDANTIAHTNAYAEEVTQSFSFNYEISPKPEISINGTFNIEDDVIGYEELITLSASEGFNESLYQWQYGFNGADDWIDIPRPASRTLDIRLIDFLDESVIGREVFFRIGTCDGNGSSNSINKRVREYGQMTRIAIDNFVYDDIRFKHHYCRGQIRITAVLEGGRRIELERFSYVKREIRFDSREYYVEGKVERMEVYMFGRDGKKIKWRRCKSGNRNRIKKTYRINLNENEACNSGRFRRRVESSNDDARMRVTFNYKVVPMPKITRPSVSNIVGYEDPVSLNAQEGFNDNVYNWQYSFLEGTPPFVWTDLAGPSSPTREIVLADVFDESVIGKEIFFRTSACDNEGTQNVVGYEIRKSAPRIIEISTTPVSCYDAEDGSVTLTFDRPLRQGDLFSFTISDLSTPDSVVVDNLNNVIDFEDGNKITLENLPPSSTEFLVEMIGYNNGEPYYTEAPYHRANFTIDRPTPVSFVGEPSDNSINVYCHGGQDGEIELTAEGGTGTYEFLLRGQNESWDENSWRSFSSATSHTIEDLFPDTYYIKIRDANECVARQQTLVNGEIDLGDEIVKEVVITQPEFSLSVTTEILNAPTAYGFEDGRIIATINGGTALNDNSYEFEWRDENNNVITTTSAIYNEGQGYLVTLHSVGEGQYTVTIRDANHDNASTKEGCTVISETIALIQPSKLEISIEVYPISCNADNEYSNNIDTNFDGVPDQFQDGVLVATVTGGVPYDIETPDYSSPVPTNSNGDLLPYFYHWKMQLSDGSWQDLAINDHYIDFLDTAANYSLNVTDKNGIVLGNYVSIIEADGSRSYELDEALDVERYLSQPDRLELAFTKADVTCANGNDGIAQVIATGGVAPYTYRWSNGDTSATINTLIAGTYLVFVTDAKGCQIEGNVKIEQSNDIEIEPASVVAPTCFEGNDGLINIRVTGGVPPYTYLWNTGATSAQIQGVSAGTYSVEITDASGCKAFHEEVLLNADPVVVNLESKRSLCGDQSLTLDISIDDAEAIYSWVSDTGFVSSDSSVTLTETGRYTATITTGRGCVGVEEVIVETFDRPIDSYFFITTQAYTGEDIVLTNVSDPLGEIVEWTIPEGGKIISQTEREIVLNFEKEGPYDINLRSYQGDCYEDFEKTILVHPAIEGPEVTNSQRNFIEEFILYPNPSNGSFKTKISLASASNITVKILHLISGTTMYERSEKDSQEFLLDYSLSLPTGVYLMLLETPKGSETRKLIFD